MTAPVDIADLIATLHGIHNRAPWAHSLTYDRPGRNLDPDRTYITGTPDATHQPPVGQWDPNGNITSAADTEAHRRFLELVRHLKGAHHDLTATLNHIRGQRVLDPTTNPLNRPTSHVTAHHIQQACHNLAALLTPLAQWHTIPEPLATELTRTTAAINAADQQFPAHTHNPPRPRLCRNPRNNRACVTAVEHTARQLCATCLQLEEHIAEDRAKRQRHQRDPRCSAAGCTARRVARGLCMGHYQRARRAGLLNIATTTL